MQEVIIYTDGGCSPNPGAGGYGVVLLCGSHRRELSGGFRLTTNNRMEILAAIKGLESLKKPCRVRLHSDSQYLVNAMTQGWVLKWQAKDWWRTKQERAANVDLWLRMLEVKSPHHVSFHWVRGHNGDPENERCDQLAGEAACQPGLPPDVIYEQSNGVM